MSSLERLIETDPSRVAEFVTELIRPMLAAQPNPGHMAIADLEARGKHVTINTQNIDGLHQRAGSTQVIELHGSIFEIRYEEGTGFQTSKISAEVLASAVYDLEKLLRVGRPSRAEFLQAAKNLFGITGTGRMYRPNLVLFDDLLPTTAWDQAATALHECDCLLIAGTSQLIHPAAFLPQIARSRGVKVVATGFDRCLCDIWLDGPSGLVLPRLVSGH